MLYLNTLVFFLILAIYIVFLFFSYFSHALSIKNTSYTTTPPLTNVILIWFRKTSQLAVMSHTTFYIALSLISRLPQNVVLSIALLKYLKGCLSVVNFPKYDDMFLLALHHHKHMSKEWFEIFLCGRWELFGLNVIFRRKYANKIWIIRIKSYLFSVSINV